MQLAVVIPTFKRADKLGPLLANLAEVTETPHRVYLIVENEDRETVDKLPDLNGYVAVYGNFGSCSKAWNAGFMASVEPYVFVGNDDIRFHEGWDTEALDKMAGPYCSKCGEYREAYYTCRDGGASGGGTHIVGTNDGNGRMFCFALVRRSYIEQHSGVYDKPATLCHEYLHNYVDTELAEYAKHRGVYAEAPNAITEHLHWEHGKADPDHPNYEKGRATCAQDHATFEQRRRAWAA